MKGRKVEKISWQNLNNHKNITEISKSQKNHSTQKKLQYHSITKSQNITKPQTKHDKVTDKYKYKYKVTENIA